MQRVTGKANSTGNRKEINGAPSQRGGGRVSKGREFIQQIASDPHCLYFLVFRAVLSRKGHEARVEGVVRVDVRGLDVI